LEFAPTVGTQGINPLRGICMKKEDQAYWKATKRLLGVILAIWLFISIGLSIILAPSLNVVKLGGYPLGFWFAQQGSMYSFIALIFIYIYLIGKIDRKYDVHEE
jgi:putative solute:sodium symporter small subunit